MAECMRRCIKICMSFHIFIRWIFFKCNMQLINFYLIKYLSIIKCIFFQFYYCFCSFLFNIFSPCSPLFEVVHRHSIVLHSQAVFPHVKQQGSVFPGGQPHYSHQFSQHSQHSCIFHHMACMDIQLCGDFRSHKQFSSVGELLTKSSDR